MRTQSVTYAEGSAARNKGAPRMASVGRVGHETPNTPQRRASRRAFVRLHPRAQVVVSDALGQPPQPVD